MSGRRAPVDILLVSLGSTFGLRAADDQLADLLRELGLSVRLARPRLPREVRTLPLTDFVQARACGAEARAALAAADPRAIIYSSTTAAMRWPRPGAVRFDALAQCTRPGRHGFWQRPCEQRRLAHAPLLLPWASSSLEGAAPDVAGQAVVLPVAIEPSVHDAATHEAVGALLAPIGAGGHRAVAVTYAADPVKKGLDRLVAAWSDARRDGEVLLVAGHGALPSEYAGAAGVVDVGRLSPSVFRGLMRAVGVFVTAPRREDYGLVQLEALAEGARVVTTVAPGPYAALPLIRRLWPEQVVAAADDAGALGRAIRTALDARPDPAEQLRATQAVGAWSRAAVLDRLRLEVVPRLLETAPAA